MKNRKKSTPTNGLCFNILFVFEIEHCDLCANRIKLSAATVGIYNYTHVTMHYRNI